MRYLVGRIGPSLSACLQHPGGRLWAIYELAEDGKPVMMCGSLPYGEDPAAIEAAVLRVIRSGQDEELLLGDQSQGGGRT
jgi:hypothetical protein